MITHTPFSLARQALYLHRQKHTGVDHAVSIADTCPLKGEWLWPTAVCCARNDERPADIRAQNSTGAHLIWRRRHMACPHAITTSTSSDHPRDEENNRKICAR